MVRGVARRVRCDRATPRSGERAPGLRFVVTVHERTDVCLEHRFRVGARNRASCRVVCGTYEPQTTSTLATRKQCGPARRRAAGRRRCRRSGRSRAAFALQAARPSRSPRRVAGPRAVGEGGWTAAISRTHSASDTTAAPPVRSAATKARRRRSPGTGVGAPRPSPASRALAYANRRRFAYSISYSRGRHAVAHEQMHAVNREVRPAQAGQNQHEHGPALGRDDERTPRYSSSRCPRSVLSPPRDPGRRLRLRAMRAASETSGSTRSGGSARLFVINWTARLHERCSDALRVPVEQHADACQGLDTGRIVVEDDAGREPPAVTPSSYCHTRFQGRVGDPAGDPAPPSADPA